MSLRNQYVVILDMSWTVIHYMYVFYQLYIKPFTAHRGSGKTFFVFFVNTVLERRSMGSSVDLQIKLVRI